MNGAPIHPWHSLALAVLALPIVDDDSDDGSRDTWDLVHDIIDAHNFARYGMKPIED